MATKRDRWSSPRSRKSKKQKIVPLTTFKSFFPEPNLATLPDTITLHIMSHLDIVSLLKLARTCKRFFHLYKEDILWTHVDMTTLPPNLDIRKTKKIIEQHLTPKLHSIRLKSNHKSKPKIDLSILNTLVQTCPNIRSIQLHNIDLSDILKEETCLLTQCHFIQRISLFQCTTPLNWLIKTNWPSLQHLSLAHSVMTSHFEVQYILNSKEWSKTLLSLDLTGCYRVQSFVPTLQMSLESLNLSGTNINDTSLEPILSKLFSLKELYLKKCTQLTNEGLLKITPSLTFNLRLLEISELSANVSQATKDHLVQTLSSNIKITF